MPLDSVSGVWWEAEGCGPPVFVGLPLMASHTDIFGVDSNAMLEGWLTPLTARFRVIRVDYPGIGRSRDIAPEDLTADRVVADLLAVANAAGADRFAYLGYSWSGAVGLQLADRTDRLTALAIGGWPPLRAPYAAILEASRRRIGAVEPGARVVLRSDAQYAQWSHFYASIASWDEAAAVEAIRCPRLVFFGGDGDLVEAGQTVPIASTIRAERVTLEAQGWRVLEIVGHGHGVALHPELFIDDVVAFLADLTA